MGVHPIGVLWPSVRVIYIWAGSGGFVAGMVHRDRSLSLRAVRGSYAQWGMYSTGSAPRPPGNSGPIHISEHQYLLHHWKYPFLGSGSELFLLRGSRYHFGNVIF